MCVTVSYSAEYFFRLLNNSHLLLYYYTSFYWICQTEIFIHPYYLNNQVTKTCFIRNLRINIYGSPSQSQSCSTEVDAYIVSKNSPCHCSKDNLALLNRLLILYRLVVWNVNNNIRVITPKVKIISLYFTSYLIWHPKICAPDERLYLVHDLEKVRRIYEAPWKAMQLMLSLHLFTEERQFQEIHIAGFLLFVCL